MRSDTIFLILSPSLVLCICLLIPPLVVIAADVPMVPTAPTNPNSNSAVDTAIKAGVHVTVDKNTGNIVFSADPSSGVKISALTLERLDQEKKMYETGFFIGYVAGFEHFQKGGKFADLIAGGPLRPISDNPITDMGVFQGKISGWRAADLAQSIKSKTK